MKRSKLCQLGLFVLLVLSLFGCGGGGGTLSGVFNLFITDDAYGCVGLGDSFDASISAIPYYQDGVMRLRDVRVESRDKDGLYIRRVRAALADSLSKEFAYRIAEDAKRILESRPEKASYSQQLVRFHVADIRVTPESLVLAVEFAVAVR